MQLAYTVYLINSPLKLASELLPDEQIPELYLNLDNKLSTLKQPRSKTDDLDKVSSKWIKINDNE